MHARHLLLGASIVALVATAVPATAQGSDDRTDQEDVPRRRASADSGDDARALLGLVVSSSSTARDTLGLFVSEVIAGGPADRAGIEEGSRLAAIDGTSLRTDPEDVGMQDAQDAVRRRLARALRGVQQGDDVELRVYAGGRSRLVVVHTAEAPPVVRRRSAGAVSGGAPGADAGTATLDGVIAEMARLQSELRQLAQQEGSGPLLDTLAQAEREMGQLRRRLQSVQGADEAPRPRGERARRSDDVASLPGLRLGTVGDELAPYYGEGSEGGLLVLQADARWAPVREGDVIVRVDGAPAGAGALRAALDAQRSIAVELLRRRRRMIVTVDPGA